MRASTGRALDRLVPKGMGNKVVEASLRRVLRDLHAMKPGERRIAVETIADESMWENSERW